MLLLHRCCRYCHCIVVFAMLSSHCCLHHCVIVVSSSCHLCRHVIVVALLSHRLYCRIVVASSPCHCYCRVVVTLSSLSCCHHCHIVASMSLSVGIEGALG